jgi:fructose-bisphosphate aldolase class II
VEKFVAETGVDFLAIAIGTAHGIYDGDPSLDLDLLREIRTRVEIPLVLHGGTGCSEEQFRAAIAGGISKINVATDLFVTAGKEMAKSAKSGNASYSAMGKVAAESFQRRCGYYIHLFGAAGKV